MRKWIYFALLHKTESVGVKKVGVGLFFLRFITFFSALINSLNTFSQNTPGNIVIILVNPTLSSEDATNSLSSLTSHVEALNNTNGVKVVENGFKPGGSWLFVLSAYSHYPALKLPHSYPQSSDNYVSTVPVGLGAAIASRLVPKSLLESNTSIDSVVDAVKSAAQIVGPGLWSPVQVLLDTPMKTPDSNVSTSVTPSWRSSAFQFVVGSTYTANASRSDEKAALDAVGKGILPMRNISPGSGSYLNEADVSFLFAPVYLCMTYS